MSYIASRNRHYSLVKPKKNPRKLLPELAVVIRALDQFPLKEVFKAIDQVEGMEYYHETWGAFEGEIDKEILTRVKQSLSEDEADWVDLAVKEGIDTLLIVAPDIGLPPEMITDFVIYRKYGDYSYFRRQKNKKKVHIYYRN